MSYMPTVGIKREQVVNVIPHKAASWPHTDSSIVFARLRQCSSLYHACFLMPTRAHTAQTAAWSVLHRNQQI